MKNRNKLRYFKNRKHGCAMGDNSLFPYYHDMGSRDSRNTVYRGLEKAKRFGFIGSTDHHAGFPGSYGDCKLAVAAKREKRVRRYPHSVST